MPSVVVISPLPAVRAGLRALLEAEGCRVVGEAARPDPSLGLAARPEVDVVVVDAAPGLDLADLALPGPGQLGPGLVILGPLADDERLPSELAGRAWGYLPRDASGTQLAAAVQAVALGLLAVDASLGGHLLARARPDTASPPTDTAEELTTREREVLELVALGLPNKAIARRLSISEHTVKFHVAAILTKLGAGSRTEAVHLAARRGLVAL